MRTKLTDEEARTVETYNQIAAIWTSKYHHWDFWFKEMQRFKELMPAGKVVDIGAGGARDAIGLTKLGYEYVGTDISEKLLDIARKQMPSCRFYKRSIYEIGFPTDEKFDGFWCSAVLLHMPKKRIGEALVGIKSILKPGAIGFISLKDGNEEKIETEVWDDGQSHQRFFSYWTKDKFTKVLERNGFKLVDYMFREDSRRTRWHCFFVKL